MKSGFGSAPKRRAWVFFMAAAAVLCGRVEAQFVPQRTFPKTAVISVVDYNKDGHVDIMNNRQVWRNNGNGTFSHVATVPQSLRSDGSGGGALVAWADLDGDGVRDVLLLGNGAWQLPLRDTVRRVTLDASGVPSFSSYHDIQGYDVPWTSFDCPYPSGTETLGFNQNATWGLAFADINKDGRLDIYLGRGRIGNDRNPEEYYGKDWLVRNNSTIGCLTFSDISEAVGMTRSAQLHTNGMFRHTEPSVVADYDMDGYPDFFVGNYRDSPNYFWKGAPGGTAGFLFSNAGEQSGGIQPSTGVDIRNTAPSYPCNGGGAAWFDFNNDGLLDLIEARLRHYEGTSQVAVRLWKNNGNGTFSNVSYLIPCDSAAGGDATYASGHYKSVAIGDFDNDGDLDIYLGRSLQNYPITKEDAYSGTGPWYAPYSVRGFGRLLRNNLVETGNASFTDVTDAQGLRNPEHMDVFGAAFIDFDGDGALDLLTAQGTWSVTNGLTELWRNANAVGHYTNVILNPPSSYRGVSINPDGIGAIAQAWVDKNGNGVRNAGEILTRLQSGHVQGSTYVGPQPLHFGLGSYTPAQIKDIRVLWPGLNGSDPENWETIHGTKAVIWWAGDGVPRLDVNLKTTVNLGQNPHLSNMDVYNGADNSYIGKLNQFHTTGYPANRYWYESNTNISWWGCTWRYHGTKTELRLKGLPRYVRAKLPGYSELSNVLDLGVLPVPATPASISYPSSASPNQTITVSWSSVAGAQTYRLQRSWNGGTWTTVGTDSSATSRNVALPASGTYAFRVRAQNDGGNSGYRTGSTYTISGLAPPSQILYYPQAWPFEELTVSWSSVSGATSYRLERSWNGGAWTLVGTVSGTYANVIVPYSGTYQFRVRAQNAAGSSDWRTGVVGFIVEEGGGDPWM